MHKFLKTNLSSYQSKCCAEFNVLKDDESLTSIDFITNDQINVSYVILPYETISHISGLNGNFNFKSNDKFVNLIYLLGNNSATSAGAGAGAAENAPPKQEPAKPKPAAKSNKKKKMIKKSQNQLKN